MILVTNYRTYLQKTVMIHLMYINWISGTLVYGVCVSTTNFSSTVVVNEREMQKKIKVC